MNLYYVEQNCVGTVFSGEYLTEAVVAARNSVLAQAAVFMLSDPENGFGLQIEPELLRTNRLGPLELAVDQFVPRFEHMGALVLAVGTARPEDDA